MSEEIPCPCGDNHPRVYAGKGTASDPIVLDPVNRRHPTCPIVTRRMAEAEREHTLALIRKKIREQQVDEAKRARTLALIRRTIKQQQKDLASGNYPNSSN